MSVTDPGNKPNYCPIPEDVLQSLPCQARQKIAEAMSACKTDTSTCGTGNK